MALWFMRWLQGVLCKQFPMFDIAAGAGRAPTPIDDHRDDALRGQMHTHASICGGAII